MNSYANKALRSPKQEPFFAPDVYREDESGRLPVGAREDSVRIRARVGAEMRGRPAELNRAPATTDMMAEITALRAAVDGLLAERIERVHERAVSPRQSDRTTTIVAARGVEGGAARALAELARGKDVAGTAPRLRTALASLVRTSPWPLATIAQERVLVAIIGPAGVGKTTTAAKLGARARAGNKTVAFISTDTFRVGAADQLAMYADLMGARFHTVTTRRELFDTIAAENADVIIVDTSGRAIDTKSIDALFGDADAREAIDVARRLEVLLCVPASLRAADAARVHRDFAIAQPTTLAVTKLDETDVPAGLVHAPFATRLPVSTLCIGHRVPEDIAPATATAIADHLFPSNPPGR